MYNKIILIGNVVKDCETKSFKNSTLAKFRIAVDDTVKRDSVLYIDVEAWDKQAEFAEKWFKKGKSVIVDGRLCMDTWEKDGKKETKFLVKASDLRFANSGGQKQDQPSADTPESSNLKSNKKSENENEEFSDVPF